MQIEQKDRVLLGRIGFMACRQCRFDEARTVFEGLQQSDPSKAGPYLGLAVVMMSEGKAAEAAAYLKGTALAVLPDDPDLKAYLGLAYFMNKQTAEAREVLTPLAGAGAAGSAASLAKSVLDQIP